MCGEYMEGIDVCCRLKLVLELQAVGSTQKYLNQDCHMQRGLPRRGGQREGSGSKGLGWKDLLRKQERQFFAQRQEKKVPRLGKILVAPKILEDDLFRVSAVANLSKTRHCFENKG